MAKLRPTDPFPLLYHYKLMLIFSLNIHKYGIKMPKKFFFAKKNFKMRPAMKYNLLIWPASKKVWHPCFIALMQAQDIICVFGVLIREVLKAEAIFRKNKQPLIRQRGTITIPKKSALLLGVDFINVFTRSF